MLSSKVIRNDIYKIYKVVVPRDYYNEELEDIINWADPTTISKAGKKLIDISNDGYYKHPITLVGINNTYSVHPGSGRYLVNRVNEDMPQLEALVINRYGTTEQMIADTFQCDPILYEEDFVSFWAYRNKPHKGKIGHTVKPFRSVDKDDYDHYTTSGYVFKDDVEHRLRFFYQGKHILDFGPEDRPVIHANIDDYTGFGRWVYEFFIEKNT